jgi:hypothetical protein
MLSRLLVDYPYSQDSLRYGVNINNEVPKGRELFLKMLSGRTNLISLADDYAYSYNSTGTKNLLQYRDYLVSTLISYSLENLLYRGKEANILTAHVQKALELYSIKEFYLFDESATFKYVGLLGSVAFYLHMSGTSKLPLDMYEDLLDLIWNLVGIDRSTTPPADRFEILVSFLGLSEQLESRAIALVNRVFEDTSTSGPLYDLRINARRSFLSSKDVLDLNKKILMGIYSNEILTLLTQDTYVYNKIRANMVAALSILKPTGVILLLQALVVEGLYEAARHITNLPQDLGNVLLSDFQTGFSAYDSTKYYIAGFLALAGDAFKVMQIYSLRDTDTDSRSMYALSIDWLKYTNTKSIPATQDPRLGRFFDLDELASDTYLSISDEYLTSLQGYPARGANPIILSAPSYIGATTATITDVNKAYPSLTIAKVDIPTNNGQEGTITEAEAFKVYVAHPGLSNNLTFNEFLDLTEASNPIIIQDSAITDNPQSRTNNLYGEQVDYYTNLNNLHYSSRPRGSTSNKFRSTGKVPSDYRSATAEQQISKSKIDGARQEFTGRMNGLSSQIKDVHLDSEVSTLDKWINAIHQTLT